MPVNSIHSDYTKMLSKWERCRDFAAGEDAVHAAGVRYLPRVHDQTTTDYATHIMRATLYNAYWRTIAGLLGMIFRKPPRLVVPPAIEEMLQDVTGTGQPFQLFIQDEAENALTIGRVGILVDYPPAPTDATQADAQAQNLRPYMLLYRAESIINWRTASINNKQALTLVVLKETEQVVDGKDEYTIKSEDRWRVLDLDDGRYRQRVFRVQGETSGGAKVNTIEFEQVGTDVYPTMRGAPLPYIPFVIMGTDDVSADVDDPPLIDLVNVLASHYRTTAIYEKCIAFSPPTLMLTGFQRENESDQVYVGSDTAIIQRAADAQGFFIEYSGSGLAPLEKALDRKEQQMAILGARMLEPQRAAVETAQTASIHRKGEESLLSSIAQALSLGTTVALKWFTEWAGADPAGVEFELNRDFYPAPMQPGMLSALISAWQQGAPGLSDQGLFDLLKAGELVSDETTLEEEQVRIAERQQQYAQQQAALQGQFGAEQDEQLPSEGA